jgi:hypothetical protein
MVDDRAARLGIGDRVWFRHAKAGEMLSYCGEGKNFG